MFPLTYNTTLRLDRPGDWSDRREEFLDAVERELESRHLELEYVPEGLEAEVTNYGSVVGDPNDFGHLEQIEIRFSEESDSTVECSIQLTFKRLTFALVLSAIFPSIMFGSGFSVGKLLLYVFMLSLFSFGVFLFEYWTAYHLKRRISEVRDRTFD